MSDRALWAAFQKVRTEVEGALEETRKKEAQRIEAEEKRRREENEKIIDLWLEPDLGTMSQYTFKTFPFAYDQGYKMGIEYAEKIKSLTE